MNIHDDVDGPAPLEPEDVSPSDVLDHIGRPSIYGSGVCVKCGTTVEGYLSDTVACPKCGGPMVLSKPRGGRKPKEGGRPSR